jgi:peptidoglycan/LPS O-acetylase OafA/YrhL
MKIDALLGLRGYLALWVVVEHTLWACGYSHESAGAVPSLGQLALHGGVAVRVFMILSGYLVSRQLLGKDRGWMEFLVRRLFRIYPTYLVALAVGVALLEPSRQVWAGLPFKAPHQAVDLRLFDLSIAELGPAIRRHMMMTHALKAGDNAYTILGQTWSLSVDWLFYLLAPLVMALLRRSPVVGAAVGMAATLALEHLTGGRILLLHYGQYFWVGILTHLLIGNAMLRQALAQLSSRHQLLALACYFAAFTATSENLAYAIWLLAVLAAGSPPESRSWLRRLLAHPAAVAAGTVSYSIYLMHMFCLLLALKALLPLAGTGQAPFAAAVMAATLATTVAIATLSYAAVEKPGIALGELIGSRLDKGARAAAPAGGGTAPVKR